METKLAQQQALHGKFKINIPASNLNANIKICVLWYGVIRLRGDEHFKWDRNYSQGLGDPLLFKRKYKVHKLVAHAEVLLQQI